MVTKNMTNETDLAKELENYRKLCFELEEKSKKDEMRCLMLETEVRDLKKKNEEIEAEITRIRKGDKGKGTVVDLTDEDEEGDKFVQLLIENNVLECEKARAETEVRSLKDKVTELVSRVCELEVKANVNENESSVKTRLDTDNCFLKERRVTEDVEIGDRVGGCNQVRKRLSFEEDGCPNNKKMMAPSTPGVDRPPFFGVIDISDEDLNNNEVPNVKKLFDSANRIIEDDINEFEGCSQTPASVKRKRTSKIITSDDEETDGFVGRSSKTASAKRRTRAARIVASDDDDTSDDDNAPICTLIKQHNSRLNVDSEDEVKENVGSRHRLKRLRKRGSKNRQNRSTSDDNETICLHGYSSSEGDEDNEGLESEGESLGGFIVESSESCSEIAPVSDDDSSDESEDGLSDFKLTLDKIGRKKVSNQKWEWDLEGDMLADFGKDAELCMRAVCALYRQQTEDEKACKGTLHHNARGFSQCDAPRASEVAEFLMDGDSSGDMNKTVEELEQHNSKGVKLCMALAVKYSKQLFEIYQNKEDPYFLP